MGVERGERGDLLATFGVNGGRGLETGGDDERHILPSRRVETLGEERTCERASVVFSVATSSERKKMTKRKRTSTSSPRARKKATKEGREARELENARRLDKLPRELWEKILDELKGDDLFPLALSCRYFRQKQNELVERRTQNGPGSEKSHLALKTNLHRMLFKNQPASADYLRFARKEKASRGVGRKKAECIRRLAAYHGHLPLLQELQAGLKKLDPALDMEAARGGHLETLQWLIDQQGGPDTVLNEWIFAHACKGGNWETVMWLRSEDCAWTEEACEDAAEGGHWETVMWLRSEGCPWDEKTCMYAAQGGHLEMLQWLRSEGCPWDVWACTGAARGGHLDVLKWLRSEGCPWDENTCNFAAEGGQMEVLKWLRSEGCPWSVYGCEYAAEKGYLDVLKYLHENGCPWDEGTCEAAARNGHLDVLMYLHENGCPWDGRTWHEASESVREWLKENGCPQW